MMKTKIGLTVQLNIQAEERYPHRRKLRFMGL